MKISVALSYNIFEPLTYRTGAKEDDLHIGQRVLVPLANKIVSGYITGLDSPYSGSLKNIIGLIDDPFRFDPTYLEFARQSATAYFVSTGIILDHALPASKKNLKQLYLEMDGRLSKIGAFSQKQLVTMAAEGVLRFFFKSKNESWPAAKPPVAAGEAPQQLLFLDRGRGRDYEKIGAEVLARGQSILLLVPDNASARFWQTVFPHLDIYNSEVRPAAREKIWQQHQQGKCGMVCGGLAAVLLPMTNLGLIIIDRASSPLYASAIHAPFQTDQLARIRSHSGGIPLLLGSASHSCTTFQQREKLTVVDRREDLSISCHIHMLKGKERGIPAAVMEMASQNFLQQKKTLILVNRIQPARHMYCSRCKQIVACPRCAGPLQITDPQQAGCRRCSFSQESLDSCPRCREGLTLLHDISLDSLTRALERVIGSKAVLPLTAASLKNGAGLLDALRASSVVIATPAVLNPFFKDTFAAVIYLKPESFFSMDAFNSAERIFTTAAEIMEVLVPGGELHVFSVFHFHYALQFIALEESFFERELKYRQWFMLPPFSNVYQLEIKDSSLRSLAATLRQLYQQYKSELQIKKVFLLARQAQRGAYRGVLELHAPPEKIIGSGLTRLPKSVIRLLAG